MIRRIEEKDYKACLDLYNYYIMNTTITLEEEMVTLEDFSNRIKRILDKFEWIVYEEDGEILGYAYLDYFHVRSAYRISCDLSIYVKNGSQKKGIGKELFNHIEKIAIERKYENMISIITHENENSIKFHEKMGFVKIGFFENIAFKFNRYIGTIYMVKKLNKK